MMVKSMAPFQPLFGARLLYDYGLYQISSCCTLGLTYGLREYSKSAIQCQLLYVCHKKQAALFIIRQLYSTCEYSRKYGKNIIKPTLSGTGRKKYKTIFKKLRSK
jgi:hypothetical protein